MTLLWDARAPKALLISVALLAFVFSVALALHEPTSANWVTVAFTVALFAPAIVLFARYKLEVYEDRLRYRSPLGSVQELLFQEIAASYPGFAPGRFLREYSVIVQPHAGVPRKPIFIALSFFRSADIARLLELPGVKYSDEQPQDLAGV